VFSGALGVIHDEVFMIPQIKAYLCTDHSPIEKYEPEDRVEIDFWFDVDIGVDGFDWSNNFQIHLVSQKKLSRIENKKSILVIPYYESWNQVLIVLDKVLRECEANDPQLMFKNIASKFAWEYEGSNRV
jgi:hypothetical protein